MLEKILRIRRIIRAVDVPVIVDVDTGYGNPLTVWKIVNDLIAYGGSGIFRRIRFGQKMWPYAGKEVPLMNIFKSCGRLLRPPPIRISP
jgi:methylisocitrate lyase